MATENKMGVMPLNRLLISMSVPMMISMLVQALYNIVDSMFVAQLSENALTAVSLAFPAQNLMTPLQPEPASVSTPPSRETSGKRTLNAPTRSRITLCSLLH